MRIIWVLVLGLLLFPARGEGQPARSKVEEGNRLYSEGRFDRETLRC